MKRFGLILMGVILGLGGPGFAVSVGERHLVAHVPSAVDRDAKGQDQVRVSVWYPAKDPVEEAPIFIGPPMDPLFQGGRSALNAPVKPGERYPVILVSHGFGGSARMMSWFTTEMARSGYVVIMVDHPGSNGLDDITLKGATMMWRRPEDLQAALDLVLKDDALGQSLDPDRLGLAGFSAGGYTALLAAGARVDVNHLIRFCQKNPQDGVCLPQLEFPVPMAARLKLIRSKGFQKELLNSKRTVSFKSAKAVFLMAPALIQSLDFSSLKGISASVLVVSGRGDQVAPEATNANILDRYLKQTSHIHLESVGHYDFLSTCMPAAQKTIAVCQGFLTDQEGTHNQALKAARDLFAARL